MITIGLTGWSDHDLICPNPKRKLEDYSNNFPVVELDSSFYAIPPARNINSWIEKTPDAFQFIPKAYRAMTKHEDWHQHYDSLAHLFETYKITFEPMRAVGKIKAILFQFPPNFICNREHVSYLRTVRQLMDDWPIAVEFRHNSWYSEEFKTGTLNFLKEMAFIHVVVDQPQTPHNSVPFTPVATNPDLTILRLHGHNYEGWLGENVDPDEWRSIRTLYNYSDDELAGIKKSAIALEEASKEVTVIFNNNSGGHAAANGKSLKNLLGLAFEELGPQQIDLF